MNPLKTLERKLTIQDAIGQTITVYDGATPIEVVVTDIIHAMGTPIAIINNVYRIPYINLFSQLRGELEHTDEELLQESENFEVVKVPEPGVNRKERLMRKKIVKKAMKLEKKNAIK